MRPAFGQHFDPAVIEPVEDAKLIRHAVVVRGVQVAESVVCDDGCEIVELLCLLTAGTVCRD